FFQSMGKQVCCSPIDLGCADKTVPGFTQVEDSNKNCCLSRSGTHGSQPPFQCSDLLFHCHYRWISKSRINNALGRVVEYLSYFLYVIIYISSTLNYWRHPGFAVLRRISRM